MLTHDPQHYGPAFADVLSPARVMPLGPGAPNGAARKALEALSVDRAFAGNTVVDADMARAALAGVWLYHDFFDPSHALSQAIDTPTGSYWHGILHRREPDYSNAKYWFRHVGHHPVFEPLAAAAAHVTANTQEMRAVHLSSEPAWDPMDFVDMCEKAARDHEDNELAVICRKIQMREWWLLFDYCYRAALAR
ncbi:MAG: hypothetical protein GC162_11190 [Planctomycetes bacterium]|nr:hypothetical protein [Planctomycetota bacterium]